MRRLGAHRCVRGVRDAHVSVDRTAFNNGNGLRADVPCHDGGLLDLETLGGGDRALDPSSNYGLTGRDVSMDFALAANEHLSPRSDGALDASFDLDDTVGVDVARDLHASGDDGQRAFATRARRARLTGPVAVLIEHCHAVILSSEARLGPRSRRRTSTRSADARVMMRSVRRSWR